MTQSDPVEITAQPLEGHTNEEVKQRLVAIGARDVKIIASLYVSATLGADRFYEIEDIAQVNKKQKRTMSDS